MRRTHHENKARNRGRKAVVPGLPRTTHVLRGPPAGDVKMAGIDSEKAISRNRCCSFHFVDRPRVDRIP
jgi:hypothetical protein